MSSKSDFNFFYTTLKYYFLKKSIIRIVFALIQGEAVVDLTRLKLKNSFIRTVSEEDTVLLWGGNYKEAYYTTTAPLENIIGVEVRFEENTWTLAEVEKDFMEILDGERVEFQLLSSTPKKE